MKKITIGLALILALVVLFAENYPPKIEIGQPSPPSMAVIMQGA